ncbi:class I SAM-dependent methyltransferase [Pseudovibrio brasiliensis]|uniref:Class I SAM-dependent methyltransferase n=1 Tax=Pseudovibrio brasiliensis TaxID=1898042 RepID=A0ABX8AMG0_9HYPH|nr:class I SAM-dependent methyltransferase [Pseudovibrio brasiliensis]QUS55950.1 class I SAM-dependent methyltransferase [Pseudovibrio brasiliensis]
MLLQAQTHNSTFIFRDKPVYKTATVAMTGIQNPKILSFGCSVGDEIATIKAFFPDSEVFACDIDEYVLGVAQKSAGHMATVFKSNVENIETHGPFDLIIASAVLCRNPANQVVEKFPFSQFHEMVSILDDQLASNGLLIITNASYRFADTAVAERYSIVRSDIMVPMNFVDVFAPDGTPFLIQKNVSSRKAYCQGPAFTLKDDEEIGDCMFKKDGGQLSVQDLIYLSPVPESFVEHCVFERSLSELKSSEKLESLIDVKVRHRLGVDIISGLKGYAEQYSWPSTVNSSKVHFRPETWHLLE